MINQQDVLAEVLDGLDTLRPVVLSPKHETAELRVLMRRLVMLVDSVQMKPSISPTLYAQVLSMLSILFDAEHGLLLKRVADEASGKVDWAVFQAHVQDRKLLLDVAQQDLPLVRKMLLQGCDLLGQPELQGDLAQQCVGFERYIRQHLQDDAKVRDELNLLMEALQTSVQAMGGVLAEVGEESPELLQTQQLLEQTLPEDPKQAQYLLQQAREGILHAGKKLTQASQSLKQTMTEHVQQMSALSERLADAEAQARNDPLTGLANRRKLTEYLTENKEGSLICLMIDIDHFKPINDRYGHDCGDEVLEKLAGLLQTSVRDTDMVARLGGEEFCIIVSDITLDEAMKLAENIRSTVELFAFETKHGAIEVHISLGVAACGEAESHKNWLKRADEALYVAKNQGRNRVMMAQ